MFLKPVKISDNPVIYCSQSIDKKQEKGKNVLELVSGNKIKLSQPFEKQENICQFIYENSKEWFNGKVFSIEKIRNSLSTECFLHSSTRIVSAIYNKDIKTEDLYKYCGSIINFIYNIDKIEIKGKNIILFIKLDVIKIYKKEKLDKKCLIKDENEKDEDEKDEYEDDSEVSDDELSADEEEFDSGDFFV